MNGDGRGEVVLSSGVDAQNPWPGLVAFTEEIHEYFYGRFEEADDLLRRVNRKNLTVLFGQSGLGKTSLLAAGLFPLLRGEGLLPVAIRLDHAPGALILSEQVKTAVSRAILDSGGRCEAASGDSGETLWECFHRRSPTLETGDGWPARLVLVFDQFEELFSIGQANEERRSRTALFLEQLADLIENRAPLVLVRRLEQNPQLVQEFDFEQDEHRVLICLREDYLAQLESLRQLMPSLGENRMRLTRMNGLRALEAVTNPGRELISREVGCQVVRFVAGGGNKAPEAGDGKRAADGLAGMEVDPSLLSLVCRELNNRRLDKRMPRITSDLLTDSRDDILHDFYERSLADQPRAVRVFVEDDLVTESGLRDNIPLEKARKTLVVHGASADAIDELVKRRLLRLEERLKIQRVELAHDVLTPVITKSRDLRQQQEEVARAEQQAEETREKARRQRNRLWLIAAGIAALLIIVWGNYLTLSQQLRTGKKERTERALAQVEQLLTARAAELEPILANLEPHGQEKEILQRLYERWVELDVKNPSEEQKQRRMRIGMALLPMEPDAVKKPLFDWMLEATDSREVVAASNALQPYESEYRERLWKTAKDSETDPQVQYRALVALAAYDPRDTRWQTMGDKVVKQLLREQDRLYLTTMLRALEPVRDALFEPLHDVFLGHNPELQDRRHVAATVLEYFTRPGLNKTTNPSVRKDDEDRFANLVLEADDRQYKIFWQRIFDEQRDLVQFMKAELGKTPEKAPEKDEEFESLAGRKANAAVTLLRLGKQDEEVWKLLRHSADPSVRTYIVHRLSTYGVPVQRVVDRVLEGIPETSERTSERRGLILSLGEYPRKSLVQSLVPEEREKEKGKESRLLQKLESAYLDDPDPGIHSSVEWLLRNWYGKDEIQTLQEKLKKKPPGTCGWEVNGQGQTLVIIPENQKFRMGSSDEGYREEPSHGMRIPRSYAIGTKEVTVAQFKKFLESSGAWKGHDKGEILRLLGKYSPDSDGPMIQVDWFWAAAYCNWLSDAEGIPQSDWCYPVNIERGKGMKMPEGFLKLKGYRLPTEAEWEYACRAGATTSRFYGRSPLLLEEFAQYSKTTGSVRTQPGGLLKPNDLGLFDVYGNVWEWCQDGVYPNDSPVGARTVDEEQNRRDLTDDTFRVLRGGAFLYPESELRSGYRYWNRPATQIRTLGFRVARTLR
jgi:formylglycine-generating enzyme required for sulfatase activity